MATALVGAAVLTSCSKDQVSEIYTPAEGDGIYSFEATSVPAVEFTPSNTTARIEVIRTSSEGETTLAITSTQSAGESTVNVLNVPSEVTFADGENFAFITVTINSDIQENTNYTLSLAFAEENCTPGGESSVTLSFTYALWESLGQGEFYDNVSGVLVKPEIIKYVGAERYRIMNPFTDEVSEAMAANVGGAVGGETTDYIEFTVDAEGMLSWDGYWNAGVLVDGTADYTSLNFFYPADSPFAGGEALVQECGMISQGLYQFAPHLSAFSNAEQTSGWVWSGVYCWMSLPGAETTVSEYLEL